MPVDSILTWLMVFLRAVGVMYLLPMMGGRAPPIMLRLGMALGLAVIVSGIVPPTHIPYELGPLALGAAGEVAVGLVLGFVAQLAFSGVELAGRVISSEVGFSAAHGMSAPELASEPLAAFLGAFAIVIFFLAGMLIVGLLTSLFQAVTGVQEATLTFAPKLIAFAGLSLLLAPWLLHSLTEYTVGIFMRMAGAGH